MSTSSITSGKNSIQNGGSAKRNLQIHEDAKLINKGLESPAKVEMENEDAIPVPRVNEMADDGSTDETPHASCGRDAVPADEELNSPPRPFEWVAQWDVVAEWTRLFFSGMIARFWRLFAGVTEQFLPDRGGTAPPPTVEVVPPPPPVPEQKPEPEPEPELEPEPQTCREILNSWLERLRVWFRSRIVSPPPSDVRGVRRNPTTYYTKMGYRIPISALAPEIDPYESWWNGKANLYEIIKSNLLGKDPEAYLPRMVSASELYDRLLEVHDALEPVFDVSLLGGARMNLSTNSPALTISLGVIVVHYLYLLLRGSRRSKSAESVVRAAAMIINNDGRYISALTRPAGRGASSRDDLFGYESVIEADVSVDTMEVEAPIRRGRGSFQNLAAAAAAANQQEEKQSPGESNDVPECDAHISLADSLRVVDTQQGHSQIPALAHGTRPASAVDLSPHFVSNQYYVCFVTEVVEDGERIAELEDDHLAWLSLMERQGLIFASGPYKEKIAEENGQEPMSEGSTADGMIIFRAKSMSHAHELAMSDPYHENCVCTFRIMPWAMESGLLTLTVSLANSEYRLE
mmetsp:Transcript_42251/g.82929  ORF Transcript_42251/g.82929 Transcript_42251/m.82929 type:complete len:575 (+) Transcript_42251:111-1835(+)|eukprot:CAMPEP_0194333748 /NCGR_PEP_ID=MMETSP0171-20130528/63857_1 /TAXON_ID=218684 /ORGANISM="Corethron pennatum, Strain L29A3" /LENGTH=574 /DNA_ID=CAMNT_0039096115 /DNA_START=96 /DNA_END=1820 /DNA_ORIENTATION=+